jgi:tRNA U34 5-carboxymethylaminomethyl modifying GTPase MnmE/TrmE
VTRVPAAGENVAILLTPPGAAAIAVIRLAGPFVGAFLAKHFSKLAPDGRCVHGTLRDATGNEIDDPVVVCSANGTVADVNVHGGTWVVQAVLTLAEAAGFGIRDTSGAPEIVYEANTELEREMLASIPLARTELALRTLLAQPEAWNIARAGRPPRHELEAILADMSLIHLLQPPRVAIVGAPNVGKSTLANQLFAQERSITADVPGTTRDWVGEIANIDGLAVMLVDTPGVRETRDEIERESITRSRAQVQQADLVVTVLDASAPSPGIPGEGWGEGLRPAGEEDPHPNPHPEYREREHTPGTLTVINKVDRLAGCDWSTIAGVRTVATSGKGVDELRRAIQSYFGCLNLTVDRPRVWTDRQRETLTRAINDPGTLSEL